MDYHQHSYRFLLETREEIDRLNRELDSLRRIEQQLDTFLRGEAHRLDPLVSVMRQFPLTEPSSVPKDPTPPIRQKTDQEEKTLPRDSPIEETTSPKPQSFRLTSPGPSSVTHQPSFSPSSPEGVTSPRSAPTAVPERSWGDLALLALHQKPTPLTLEEIVGLVQKMEGCPESADPRNAVRVALTRRQSEVVKEGRGRYRLASSSGPSHLSGPSDGDDSREES